MHQITVSIVPIQRNGIKKYAVKTTDGQYVRKGIFGLEPGIMAVQLTRDEQIAHIWSFRSTAIQWAQENNGVLIQPTP